MVVGHASIAVSLLLNDQPTADNVWARLERDDDLHAPASFDLEVANALRNLGRSEIGSRRAHTALRRLGDLNVDLYPHDPLLERMWELRENLTAYDAAYIALAEALDAPLLTEDAALADVPGVRCAVALFT